MHNSNKTFMNDAPFDFYASKISYIFLKFFSISHTENFKK